MGKIYFVGRNGPEVVGVLGPYLETEVRGPSLAPNLLREMGATGVYRVTAKSMDEAKSRARKAK